MAQNILLVDNNINESQIFVNSCNDNTKSFKYNTQTTEQDIINFLSTFNEVDRLCFIFDYTHDYYFLGKPLFNSLSFLVNLINGHNIKHIDFLACETLLDNDYLNFYDNLIKQTGITVGASRDKTGNINYGGNWVMESSNENIEAIYFNGGIQNYQYLLGNSTTGAIMIMADSSLYGVGSVGFGDSNNVYKPIANTTGKRPVMVSSGTNFSIILMNDNSVYGIGNNDNGQLGLGNSTSVNVLTQITIPVGKTVKQVSCGTGHTVILMTDSTVYCAGLNSNGQLGNGGTVNSNTLVQMTNSTGRTPSQIAAGINSTFVLMGNNTIYGCGSNGSRQINPANTSNQLSLFQITNGTGQTVSKIFTGGNYLVALMTTSPYLYALGNNASGQLALNNTTTPQTTFAQMTNVSGNGYGAKTPTYVACANNTTLALMSDGTVFGTGLNGGKLGVPDSSLNTASGYNTQFLKVPLPTGKQASSVYVGSNFSAIIMTDGSVYATGSNSNGQLGINFVPSANLINNLTQCYKNDGAGKPTTLISNAAVFPEALTSYVYPLGLLNAPICFVAGTPVKTDQGLIEIEKINPKKHTIRNKKIVAITQTICPQKLLVCIEKDALGPNVPSQKTITTKDHQIFFNKQMIEPRKLVGQLEGVRYIKNKGEILYNVLMEQHDKMIVNNMITETLHPDNLVAKLHTGKFTQEEKNTIIIDINECVKTNNERKFKKLCKSLSK